MGLNCVLKMSGVKTRYSRGQTDALRVLTLGYGHGLL